jgi:hypothetical protein
LVLTVGGLALSACEQSTTDPTPTPSFEKMCGGCASGCCHGG